MIGLALFVYIRPEHTRKVMESIKRNGFDKIYIFQDGLRKEEDRENWEKVSALVKSMDLIEADIRSQPGRQNFRLDCCLEAMEAAVDVEVNQTRSYTVLHRYGYY